MVRLMPCNLEVIDLNPGSSLSACRIKELELVAVNICYFIASSRSELANEKSSDLYFKLDKINLKSKLVT